MLLAVAMWRSNMFLLGDGAREQKAHGGVSCTYMFGIKNRPA